MFLPFYRSIILLFVAISLTGCQSFGTKQPWPAELPDKQLFIDAYLEKRNLETVAPDVIETHLSWIRRFYQGTLLYPNGWNQATQQFLATVKNSKTKREVRRRMRQLGIDIANEWAQDNHYRNIDNTNVAIWGSALREAAERSDHLNFITKVEADVAKLVAREIAPSQIQYERYYPEEDYGNF
ncbi:hypothetical protein [Arenicella xantha]|uniref:Lipoprotein n=1 Tax=Arenicella xantha TaxID=644221 RepID=A0A395JQ99_9GAMM|nr:hypothetical protein [Arenicella xantha]RBP50890.1 hypothetical protein DFR28_102306 [Arenicella xantha]